MADRKAVAKRSAREAYEALDRKDQQALDRIVRNLCEEPWIDAPVKTKFDVPPVVVTLYNDKQYWVVYHLPDNGTLEVWMVGKAPNPPEPYTR
jgi:hypothetical protein